MNSRGGPVLDSSSRRGSRYVVYADAICSVGRARGETEGLKPEWGEEEVKCGSADVAEKLGNSVLSAADIWCAERIIRGVDIVYAEIGQGENRVYSCGDEDRPSMEDEQIWTEEGKRRLGGAARLHVRFVRGYACRDISHRAGSRC